MHSAAQPGWFPGGRGRCAAPKGSPGARPTGIQPGQGSREPGPGAGREEGRASCSQGPADSNLAAHRPQARTPHTAASPAHTAQRSAPTCASASAIEWPSSSRCSAWVAAASRFADSASRRALVACDSAARAAGVARGVKRRRSAARRSAAQRSAGKRGAEGRARAEKGWITEHGRLPPAHAAPPCSALATSPAKHPPAAGHPVQRSATQHSAHLRLLQPPARTRGSMQRGAGCRRLLRQLALEVLALRLQQGGRQKAGGRQGSEKGWGRGRHGADRMGQHNEAWEGEGSGGGRKAKRAGDRPIEAAAGPITRPLLPTVDCPPIPPAAPQQHSAAKHSAAHTCACGGRCSRATRACCELPAAAASMYGAIPKLGLSPCG